MTRLKRKKDLPSGHDDDVRFGTPSMVAEYRAERLCEHADTMVEVGAGAGFQTRAFRMFCDHVIAVDIDVARLERGDFPKDVVVIAGNALAQDVFAQVKAACTGRIVVFLDPERPPRAKERTLDEVKPDLKNFVDLYSELGDVAIELPPFLTEIPWVCEREYLSVDGELNRLTVYLGQLKKCDVSVVRLPEWKRVEHSGELPKKTDMTIENPKYVLVPDRALEHAGLTMKILPERFQKLSLGNKRVFLTETSVSSLFATYEIHARGKKEEILACLSECQAVILHGKLSPNEQRALLRELNPYCTGKRRAHLFIGKTWYLCWSSRL